MEAKIVRDPEFADQYRVVFYAPEGTVTTDSTRNGIVRCDAAGTLFVTCEAKADLLDEVEGFWTKVKGAYLEGCDVFPVGDKRGAEIRGALSIIDGFIDPMGYTKRSIHKSLVAGKDKSKCMYVTHYCREGGKILGHKGRIVERRRRKTERVPG
ncbi:hypothetical protein ACBY01_07180 [Sphingomonas sp. ac-8]|uniref:hypothetical protein n=1 Tax=Sphingomonas sp. ac-8 TaxID=3242977 RepID=UPI003A80DD1A